MDKSWYKEYPLGVPREINPDEYDNLGDFFDKTCNKYSSNTAIESLGSTISFANLKKYVDNLSGYLQHELKLKKGDKLAIVSPNLPQYVISLFAALKLGVIVVNLNPQFTTFELKRYLGLTKPNAIIVLENFMHKLQECNFPAEKILVASIGDFLGLFKGFIFNIINRLYNVTAYNKAKVHNFATALKYKTSAKIESFKNTQVAFYQLTGGTTGKAKAAVLTHRNILANMMQGLYWVKPKLDLAAETFVNPLPMYHVFSLASTLMFFSIGAKTILIADPRKTKLMIKQIKNSKFSIMIGVNTLFDMMINHQNFSSIDFSALKLTLSGGMSVSEKVATKWKQATDCHILEAYGLTESSPAISVNPLTTKKYNGSVGLPLPSTDVCIKSEDGTSLPAEQPGEIWAQGPQVMQGYLNNEADTKLVMQDNWLKTGDYGYMDKKGYLYIKDRIKDLIIVSGFNVYPSEIEQVLNRHAAVEQACVIGIQHKDSEKVIAFVVVKQKIKPVVLMEHCRKYLTRYKIPKKIVFIQSLPKTSVGKISKAKLKKIAVESNL